MDDVVFELGKDRKAIGEARDSVERQLQEGGSGLNALKKAAIFGVEGRSVVHPPVLLQPLEAASAYWGDNGIGVLRKFDDQRAAGFLADKAVSLRGARIPGPGIDPERAVPIAKRKIIEPREPVTCRINRHGRITEIAIRERLDVRTDAISGLPRTPEAFRAAAAVMAQTGASGVKLEGGRRMAETIEAELKKQ